jgi:hypothetical protein
MNKKMRVDTSKLLGFRLYPASMVNGSVGLGAKIGTKTGAKPGLKPGASV